MNDNRATNRRELLRAGLGLGLTAGAPAAVGASLAAGKRLSEELDLSTPDGNLRTYVKLLGSIADSIAYISFQGTLWGLLPGRAPTAVCGFHGLARYTWQARDNDTYYQKSFDVGYFSKLDSGERLDTMINPLTDETIEPYHYKYGGYERLFAADGASWIDSTGVVQDPAPIAPRWQLSGDQLWFTESRQGDVPSPLDAKDWPREAPGERYVYGGETTFAGSVKQLSDATVTTGRLHTILVIGLVLGAMAAHGRCTRVLILARRGPQAAQRL